MKTLLVAVGLLLGTSAWADNVNLTPTADTYFSWASDEAKATSYGTAETLYTGLWQEKWDDGTPGLRDPYTANKHIAVFKFDVSAYKGKITAATFKVTGTNPSSNSAARSIYLGYFDLTTWDESSTANTSGMNTRSASDLNIHPFSISQSIAKDATTEVSFSNDALLTYLNNDADGIVSLIIYGLGQECYVNSKEAASGKPSLALTYTNETLYTATFTANEGAITPEVTIYSDEGRETPVSNGTLTDKTTYYYRAVLAGYDNYEGTFTVNGANPSISFTMTAKTRYTFKVNAVNSVGGAVLKTIYEDADSYEGKYHNLAYPKYLTGDNNIVTYSKDDDTYGEGKTAQAKNETYTVSYTAYDGVAYFVEVEDVVSSTDYSSWYCSNGAAVRGFKDIAKNIFTIPATGVYDVTYAACNNNVNYDMAVTLSKNETEIATKSDFKSISINYIKTTGIVKNSNISLAKDDVLKLTPSTTNAIIDYMLIELKSVPATITSSTGYATFSSTHALDFSEVAGLTAYTATACDGTNVTLTPISGTVAANTGLVIKGETTDIPVVATGDAQNDNLMKPCDGSWTTLSKSDTGTNYVLSVQNSVAVFAPIGEESATLRAGSAYLYVPTSGGARALNIVFDEDATGIASVKSESNAVNGYYNLAGQRIAQPTKGLYIVNGKKVVIK